MRQARFASRLISFIGVYGLLFLSFFLLYIHFHFIFLFILEDYYRSLCIILYFSIAMFCRYKYHCYYHNFLFIIIFLIIIININIIITIIIITTIAAFIITISSLSLLLLLLLLLSSLLSSHYSYNLYPYLFLPIHKIINTSHSIRMFCFCFHFIPLLFYLTLEAGGVGEVEDEVEDKSRLVDPQFPDDLEHIPYSRSRWGLRGGGVESLAQCCLN